MRYFFGVYKVSVLVGGTYIMLAILPTRILQVSGRRIKILLTDSKGVSGVIDTVRILMTLP